MTRAKGICKGGGMSSKVLIIGIDGVRYDTLQQVQTPAIDRIAEAGFLTPIQVNQAGPTISGPGWTTIFTGALADRHQIFGNDFTPNRLDAHPDLIELARQQRPEVRSFVAAGWLPLITTDSGDPLFAGGGWQPEGDQAHSVEDWHRADQAVTDAVIEQIADLESDQDALMIAYLGGCDEVAHMLGCGQEYRSFITDSDRRTGELLAAIQDRTDADDWTVLVVTDHGHIEPGGHGGDSELERTAWIAACGEQVPTQAPDHAEQADIAGHTAHLLGLSLPEHSFGVPLGTR